MVQTSEKRPSIAAETHKICMEFHFFEKIKAADKNRRFLRLAI